MKSSTLKTIFFGFLFLFSTTIFSQVGINTTTPEAGLDIISSSPNSSSEYKGIQVNVTSTTSTTAPTYGIYSEVDGDATNNNVYSGYFLGGKVAVGKTDATNYVFPENRGTNKQIMQTDGSGNLSWVDNRPISSIPIYAQHDAIGYVVNNTAGQDLGLMDSAIEPSVYNTSGNIQVKLVVRYNAKSATTVNFQLRAYDGGPTDVYPITNSSGWNFATTNTSTGGGIAASDWINWNAGTNAYEIHVNAWVDNNSITIANAYLLVCSQ